MLFSRKSRNPSSTCKAPARSGRWDNCDSSSVLWASFRKRSHSWLEFCVLCRGWPGSSALANETNLLRYCPFETFGQLEVPDEGLSPLLCQFTWRSISAISSYLGRHEGLQASRQQRQILVGVDSKVTKWMHLFHVLWTPE